MPTDSFGSPRVNARRLGAALALLCTTLCVSGSACSKKDTRAAPPEAPVLPTAAPPPAAPVRVAPEPFVAGAGPERFALVYTASVEGYVQPCGCTAEPLGGLARFAAVKAQADAAYGGRVLFVDAGDLLFEEGGKKLAADACQSAARHDLLIDTYADLGLAVTVRGVKDDARGAAWRDGRLARRGIVTVDTPGTGRAPVEGAKVVAAFTRTLGAHTVAVLGYSLFGDDAATKAASVGAALAAEAKAQRAKGAAVVVVLAQSPRAITQKVLKSAPGVDVAVQGDDPGAKPYPPETIVETGARLVSAGLQAQYMGVLEFVLEGPVAADARLALDDREGEAQRRAQVLQARVQQLQTKVAEADDETGRKFFAARLARAEGERKTLLADALAAPPPKNRHVRIRALELASDRPEAPTVKSALEAYETAVPGLTAQCEAGIECEAPAPGAAVYVGEQACFACHKDAVKFWRNQKVEVKKKSKDGRETTRLIGHSKAWKTLVDEGKDKDRTCVQCHSVGFNEPGGYCKTSEVGFRKNVQCESCHGPGSLHANGAGDPQALSRGKPGEATCRGCHHVPHIETPESFVFEDKLKLILGPGHGEVRWKALK